MNTKPCGCTHACNCSDKPPATVPHSVVNPAGSNALRCRIGTHGTFLESMIRRLSSQTFQTLAEQFRSRNPSDPSIALLDAWATAGDVLTFYNERLINEGYLRTATEHRSLNELSALIGYRPGPGVASSVYLAFSLEKALKQASDETLIPRATAVKSVPGDGEMPQTFETSEAFLARAEWNALKPRQTIPQSINSDTSTTLDKLYVCGTDVHIKPNDEILISVDSDTEPVVRIVTGVQMDQIAKVTQLSLKADGGSISRLHSEVVSHVDAFLATPKPASFEWMIKAVVPSLERIAKGEGNHLPLNRLKRLSDYDAVLSRWLESLTEENVDQAIVKLTKNDSPFVIAHQKLLKATTTEFSKLVTAAQLVCDELLELDDAAQACLMAANQIALNGSQVSIPKIKALKLSIDGTLTSPPIIAIKVLKSHRNKLAALQKCVDNMAAVDAAVKFTDPLFTAFTNAKDDLKTWWGLTESANLNGDTQPPKGATAIHKAFADFKRALEGNGSNQSKVQAIVDQRKAIEETQQIGGNSPGTERIKALSIALKTPLESYGTLIKSATPDITLGSAILAQLDQVFLRDFRTTTDVARLHRLAENLISKKDDVASHVDATRQLAHLMKLISRAIEDRRVLFANRAQSLLDLYDELATSPNQAVKNSWNEAKAILAGVTKTDQNAPLDQTLHISRAVPFSEAIDQFEGTETDEGLITKLESLANSTDIQTKQVLLRLKRDLKQFVALNGESRRTASSPIQKTGGGIGQALGEEGLKTTDDGFLIRIADEVLSIPNNTAADVVAQLAASFGLITQQELKAKWESIQNAPQTAFASTVSAPLPLFGHNAPRPIFNKDLRLIPAGELQDWELAEPDRANFVYLAAEQISLKAPFWLRLRLYIKGIIQDVSCRVTETAIINRSDYGLTQKVTRCLLDSSFHLPRRLDIFSGIDFLRTTLAIVPQRRMELAEARIPNLIGKDAGDSNWGTEVFDAEVDQIELDGIFLGFKPGQFVIIEGERKEFPGVITRELKRIKFARHKLRTLPGDTVHTRIYLNSPLLNTYSRETVTVYANVVRATHGETVRQVLGSGNTTQPFQKFHLSKGPLTYLAAASATGIESTLSVRVNNLQWHEEESLLDSGFGDRCYSVHADNDWKSSVQFGDGKSGARVPTGQENVRAEYRVGLGTSGNVKAGAITQLAGNKPLGLKEVLNPMPATGGADPENPNQIRANAPLAVMALDRLVSVRDYAAFARNFAAIDKAVAKRFLINGQPTVHVTIAGAGDLPIADDSDLLMNLKHAYRRLGDNVQPVTVDSRELLLIFLSARIRLLPDYEWPSVESEIRRKLYEDFSFFRRELAQDVYLSDVQSSIHAASGVAYVDVDIFATLSKRAFEDALKQTADGNSGNLEKVFESLRTKSLIPDPRLPVASSRIDKGSIRPAQIAYLSADVPDSLFLSEIK